MRQLGDAGQARTCDLAFLVDVDAPQPRPAFRRSNGYGIARIGSGVQPQAEPVEMRDDPGTYYG
jgi:hypothetical protein